MTAFPTSPDEFTPELVSRLIQDRAPGAVVERLTPVESKVYGDGMVSTAGRIVFDLDYAAGTAADLPRRVVIRVARGDRFPKPLYGNEVAFYMRLRPEMTVEAPRAFGGTYDADSGTFGLILEDLRDRHASFPNVTTPISLDQVRGLIRVVAQLHAAYWQSPRFGTDLAWLETHLSGGLHHLFNEPSLVPAVIEDLIATEQFKREMVERLGTTAQRLFEDVALVQEHQSRLQQTILHGDTHVGNTYLLPGDRGGLLDWQLMVRGYGLHDITYLIVTGLSVATRRAHERELLRYYRERLIEEGATNVPGDDEIWLEYRRAAVWGVYIGWLTTPVENYGWEICVMNHLRVMTAYEDLETGKLLAAMR